MNVADNDGELGVEQPFLRPIYDAHSQQPAVDEAIASEQGDPGNHANHDRGPEGYRADEEEHCLGNSTSQLKGEKVSDEEAEYSRNRPDNGAEFHGGQIGAVGDRFRKDLPEIVESEGGDQNPIGFVAEEADHY